MILILARAELFRRVLSPYAEDEVGWAGFLAALDSDEWPNAAPRAVSERFEPDFS